MFNLFDVCSCVRKLVHILKSYLFLFFLLKINKENLIDKAQLENKMESNKSIYFQRHKIKKIKDP